MDAIHQRIKTIYDTFSKFWQSPACRRTCNRLEELSKSLCDPPQHPLGRFVILYTPAHFRPPLLLVGKCPSWFHVSDSQQALKNLEDVAEQIPTVNSYLDHDHKYGRELRGIFQGKLNRHDLLEECVGLNRFWIQTGSVEIADIFEGIPRDEKKAIVGRCEEGTREIIRLLQPQTVALLGTEAQRAMGGDFRGTLPETVFQDCRSPARGGMRECAENIEELIAAAGLD